MAESSRVASSEYTYCTVCKRNHDQSRKHIFTKHHKEKLTGILAKLLKKVKAARKVLHKPRVYEGELEPGATMWCYCCEQEVGKHVTDGLTSVEWGGLLEHMACSSHHKKTRTFWWEHGVDKSQLQSLLIFDAELLHFKEKVVDAMDKLENARDKRIKEAADKIRDIEQSRMQCATSEPLLAGPSPPPPPPASTSTCQLIQTNQTCSSCTTQSLERVLNMKKHGERKRPSGNIHTGATPPWLMDDNEDSKDRDAEVVAGPSLEAFLKYKEKQSWASKNPRCVGADFHQRLKSSGQLDVDDEDWLPSFGRVWNFGPRSHSRVEFQNILTKTSELTQASSSQKVSCTHSNDLLHVSSSPSVNKLHHPPNPPRVVPYVRRRPYRRPHIDALQ